MRRAALLVGIIAVCLATRGAAQSEKLQGTTYRSPTGTTLRLMLDESNVGPEVTLGERPEGEAVLTEVEPGADTRINDGRTDRAGPCAQLGERDGDLVEGEELGAPRRLGDHSAADDRGA